jgi:signal peptidase I
MNRAVVVIPVTAVLALAVGAVLRLRRRYVAIDVVGVSMEPTYRSGGRVLVRRTPCAKVRRGEAVVFEWDYGDPESSKHPDAAAARPPAIARRSADRAPVDVDRSWMLKRTVAIPGDPIPRDRIPALHEVPERVVPAGHLVVVGDNPAASLDSRHFGYVRQERVLGIVVRRLSIR